MSEKLFKVGIEMPPLPALEGETELSLFDPQNPDLNLLNLVDEEQILELMPHDVLFCFFYT